MTGPEDVAEAWLSLSNEQRTEQLAMRRKKQLDEKDGRSLPAGEPEKP